MNTLVLVRLTDQDGTQLSGDHTLKDRLLNERNSRLALQDCLRQIVGQQGQHVQHLLTHALGIVQELRRNRLATNDLTVDTVADALVKFDVVRPGVIDRANDTTAEALEKMAAFYAG